MVSEDGSRGNRGKGSQKGFGEKIAVLCGSCLVTWLFADDDSAEVWREVSGRYGGRLPILQVEEGGGGCRTPRDVALSSFLEKYLQTCAKGEGPTGCSG